MKLNWRILFFVFVMVFYTLSNASYLAAGVRSIPKSHTEGKKIDAYFIRLYLK